MQVYDQGKTIPENLLAYIAFCVVTALEYLRKDLVTMHRDVKPSNILIDRAGHVKVRLPFVLFYSSSFVNAWLFRHLEHIFELFAPNWRSLVSSAFDSSRR